MRDRDQHALAAIARETGLSEAELREEFAQQGASVLEFARRLEISVLFEGDESSGVHATRLQEARLARQRKKKRPRRKRPPRGYLRDARGALVSTKEPTRWRGKTFAEMTPAERCALFGESREMYHTLWEDHTGGRVPAEDEIQLMADRLRGLADLVEDTVRPETAERVRAAYDAAFAKLHGSIHYEWAFYCVAALRFV
jgi:hypothetical protein